VNVSDSQGAGTIIDDDDPPLPEVSLTTLDSSAKERGTASEREAKFQVSRTGSTVSSLTVYLHRPSSSTAESGDFSLDTALPVVIPAGSSSVDITLKALPDTDDHDETVIYEITPNTTYTIDSTASTSTMTIQDRPMPVVSLSGGGSEYEGSTTTPVFNYVTFTVSIPYAPGGSGGSVYYKITPATGTGVWGTDSVDFISSLTGTLSFGEFDTTASRNIYFRPDFTVEATEQFVLTLISRNGEVALPSSGSASASGTIINDDKPVATLSPPATNSWYELNPGDSPLNFGLYTVTLDQPAPPDTGAEVSYEIVGVGADPANDTDFAVATSDSISFAAGETSKDITVTINPDLDVEPNETFEVQLTGGTNADVSPTNYTAPGTILNDDEPTASIALISMPPEEGDPSDSASIYTFEVTLSDPPGGTGGSVNFQVVPGSGTTEAAEVLEDFDDGTYPLSGTVSFGAADDSKLITIEVARDTVIEPDEEFVVELTGASNIVVSSSANTAAATIKNDDFPVASISPSLVEEYEGTGGVNTMTYTVNIDAPLADPLPFTVTVDYSVAGMGMYPTDGSDFAGGASGTVSFSGLERSKMIVLDLSTDSDAEPDEEFLVTLSVPTGGNTTLHPTNNQADGKILNDDKPTVSIELLPGEAPEKDEGQPGGALTTFDFVVKLTSPPGSIAPSGSTVSVDYSVAGVISPVDPANGSADTTDFQPPIVGTIDFGPTEDEKTITVTVNPDYFIEDDEEFEVVLSNPNFLIIDPLADRVAAIIKDDDTPEVSLAVTDSEARERNGDQFGWLTLSRMGGDPGIPLSVSFTTEESGSPPTPGIADLGSDYSLASPTTGAAVSYSGSAGTFTIPAGATSIDIELTALRDFLKEGDETATITLTPSTQYDITPGSESGDVTVKDSPHIRIEATEPAAFESTTTDSDTLGPKNGEYSLTLVNASAGPVDAVFEWNTPAPGLANPPSSLGPSSPPELTDKDYDLSGGYS